MASGSFGVSTSNGYISGRVDWSSTTNVSGNYSTVTATLYLSRTNTGYETWGSGSFTMNINGNQKTNSGEFHFTYNSNTVCVSHTVDVGHNSDGTKSITITASGGISVFSMNTASATVGLDTIPRASSIGTFGNFNIGDSIPVTINRASSSFTHELQLWINGSFIKQFLNIGDSTTLTFTQAEIDNMYSKIPNSTSTTATLYCWTNNGSTSISTGWATKNSTATVPSTIVPTFTTITHSENVSDVNTLIGKYVQNISKLNLAITGAAGAKSSTINNYKISFEGTDYNSSSAISNVIRGSGTLSITGTITDSRGRTASKSVNISVLPYTFPQISSFTLSRCNSDGTANDMGTYCKVASVGSVSSLLNGTTEKNSLTYTIYSKLRADTSWTSKKSATITGVSLNASDVVSSYTATSSFDFRLDITDKFNTTLSLTSLPTGEVTMSWSSSGVGIGKVWEMGVLDVDGDIYEAGTKLADKYAAKVYAVPVGTIAMWGGSTAPTGWMLCQGQAISRTTYSALYAVLGTTYGTGDGSTTFNIPDIRSRMPVGLSVTDISNFKTLNEKGGAKTHTLTTNEMPSHSHNVSFYNNGRGLSLNSGYGGSDWSYNLSWGQSGWREIFADANGGGQAHNNLPPYITLNFIIKT